MPTTTRPPEQRHSKTFWRSTVTAFHASGLGKKEFCAQHDLNPGRLTHSIRTLQEKPSISPVVDTPFVELGAMPRTIPSLELHLDLGGGLVLSVVRN